LTQKITLTSGGGNPYYDNSFDGGARVNTEALQIDEIDGDSSGKNTRSNLNSQKTVVPLIKTPSDGRYDRFEVLTTPPDLRNEFYEDFSARKNYNYEDNILYSDRANDYRQDLRDFGRDGELKKRNLERNRDDYANFLMKQI
jgi:hypothetical protein